MFGRVFTTIRTKTPRNVYDVRSEDTIVLLRTTWCIDMKVTINSFKAVATWKWDLPEESDDTCGICRVNFEGTCSKCKFPGDDCPIIVGECRHCFHMVRVESWDEGAVCRANIFSALHQ